MMPVLRVKREKKLGQMIKEELVWGRQVGSTPREGDLHFRRLLEKLPAGAYTCDPEGLITYYNQHAVHLWGCAPKLNDPVDRFCGSLRGFCPDRSQIGPHPRMIAPAPKTNRGYN